MSLAPWLSVRGSAKALEFYKSAFDAREVFRFDGPNGSVVARLAIGETGAEFWLADESPEHGNFSPETLNGSTVRLILVVADPDSVFARACAAGAKQIHAVTEGHGWRVGRVVDPFGHHWEIGIPLASDSLEITLARSESGTERSTSRGRWSALGFTLKGLLTEAWGVFESRIELAPDLDTTTRYDVSLTSLTNGSEAEMLSRIQPAIEQHLRIRITRAMRPIDICVLTRPIPEPAAAVGPCIKTSGMGRAWTREEVAVFQSEARDPESAIEALLASGTRQIPAIGHGFASSNRFRPFSYGLVIVGEPDADGDCAIQIDFLGPRGVTKNRLFEALRNDLGIEVTEERRKIEMFVVRRA